MLDIKFIREHPEFVQEKIRLKRSDIDIAHVLKIDQAYRDLLQTVESLRSERNKMAQERNVEEGRRVKELLDVKERELLPLKEELDRYLMLIPNLPDDDVPVGKDESENVELRKWGEPKQFDFEIKDHVDIGKALDIIDIEKAGVVTGSRFYYLKGDAVLLEFALLQFVMQALASTKVLTQSANYVEADYPTKPFIPVLPPVMIRPETYMRMARLDPGQEEERYFLQRDNLYLIGSAEHTMGPLHMDETLRESQFPLRYVGFSSSFRRESGSYGKDVRGILRVHQFDKIEIESFTTPENGRKEQDFIVALQEYLMQQLYLPYRVMAVCTGDMGGPDARQIDIDTWIPSQNMYRETHSSDYVSDYQSRRLNTKVKRDDGANQLVHMNDATVFAIARTLIAILENYQNADGTVTVPEVLQPYIGKDVLGL